MIPTIDETKQIIENTKHANIDIKETISKTVKAGWIDSNYYVLTPSGAWLPDVFEDEGLKYELLSDSYFEYIDKLIDEDGIYIALAYATEEAYSDTIIKYGVDDEDIEEDECFGCGICTWKEDITLYVPAELEIGDDESDYGILITKKDEKLEITFAYNESVRFGHGMGYNKIYSIEDKFDTGHMLLMKLISEAIVLKN